MKILTDEGGLAELVHDRWFDVGEVRYLEEEKEFRLHFSTKRKGPYDENLLRITNVTGVEIKDEASLELYNLRTVEITPNSVRLISSFPLEILLTVNEGSEISVLEIHPQN